MELSNGATITLIGIAFFIIYTIRKFHKDPLDGILFILKILKVIRWVLTGIVSILYFILPFDIIPDIVIPFGWLDDIGMVLLAHTVFKFVTFADKLERKKQEIEERIRDSFRNY